MLSLFTCSCSTRISPNTLPGWHHIELGASNYGEDPEQNKQHPGADQSHFSNVTDPNQHQLLFKTVDTLIATKGIQGVFYLNDLTEKDVAYTKAALTAYLAEKYPEHEIYLLALVGDFFKINLPKVDSIHLKNPEYFFFKELDKRVNQTRLKYFSNQAKEAFTLVTYYYWPLIHRLKSLGVACKIINRDCSPYIHVDGAVIDKYGPTFEFVIRTHDRALRQSPDYTSFITDIADNCLDKAWRNKIKLDIFDIYGPVSRSDDDEQPISGYPHQSYMSSS